MVRGSFVLALTALSACSGDGLFTNGGTSAGSGSDQAGTDDEPNADADDAPDSEGDEGASGGADSTPDDTPGTDVIEYVVFTEVAQAAGISHSHGEMGTPGNCLVDTVIPAKEGWFCALDWSAAGAAAGDYDADGFVDLYVTRLYEPSILYRNRGDGTFEDATAAVGLANQARGSGVAWADFDNDGDLDLYVATIGELGHKLFINDDGWFTDEADERGASLADGNVQTGTSVAVGDYDNDGWLDLYVGDWHTFAIGDHPSHARLLHNRGAADPGSFDDVTVAAGVVVDDVYLSQDGGIEGTFVFSAGWSDLDGDGLLDLLLASDFDCSRLFWNQGDGTFLDTTEASGVGTDENGMGSAVADFDGDGDLDWFVSSIDGPLKTGNRMYAYAGDRTFVDVTDQAGVRHGFWGWGAVFFDQENDGDPDLAQTNGWNGTLYLDDPLIAWTNASGGTLGPHPHDTGLVDDLQGRALLSFDYDRDGDLDLFMTNHGREPRLFRNDTSTNNHWLQVEVRGTVSNRDAIGARIELTAGGVTQIHEVGGTSHFMGHSDRVAHFGLGEADSVDSVRVVFPASGAEVVEADLDADHRITIVEPG